MAGIILARSERISESFHGRDLFAPVAAKLANGENVDGSPLEPTNMVGFGSAPDRNRVIYLDHFGNAMTGVKGKDVRDDTLLVIKGKSVRYARTFCEVPVGTAFWYRNSVGLVEFAVNCGSAAGLLDLELGMPFEIHHL